MNTSLPTSWQEANQRYLMAALAMIRMALEHYLDRVREKKLEGKEDRSVGQGQGVAANAIPAPTASEMLRETSNSSEFERDVLLLEGGRELEAAAEAMPAPSALETLCETFDLSDFERDVVLLCAGMELEAAFPRLCAAVQGGTQQAYPTFSLALTVLPDAHLSAIAPSSPLHYWRLIEVDVSRTFTLSPLRLDRWVLHYLTGMPHLDERLSRMVKPLSGGGMLIPSYQEMAERIAATWVQASQQGALPIVQLCGDEVAAKRAIAAAACAMVGMDVYVMSAHAIPQSVEELDTIMRLWEREVAMSNHALLLDCDSLHGEEAIRESAINLLLEEMSGIVMVTTRDRRHLPQRPTITFEIGKPTAQEQRTLWENTLGDAISSLNGQMDGLVSQFHLSAPAIRAASIEALGQLTLQENSTDSKNSSPPLPTLLWDICRVQSRPQLDDLAQRIEPAATWEDLVLPEAQQQILRDIAVHVRQRGKVYETWGFASKGSRGLGISALFAGSSGTGKTMAAEVLAHELRLDLYRIDLSAVVSKYIGETEKNLRRVFDAAESGGTILLFDEADALFGKRSEVKDSHDRHANIEVSYLLQRMEAYRGLAILTTNLKDALDRAFLRRIRFVVQFPFPDASERAEIWRRIFPAKTLTEGLDVEKLAQLNVAGGNIRNIAMNAAFLAADTDEPVRMSHLLRAAKSEYSKLEKGLTDVEVRGWV